jgi:hypothetical protein
MATRSVGVSPGATKAHTWYREHRHREDDPDDDRDLELDDEGVTQPGEVERRVAGDRRGQDRCR